jgi:putative ABC transport system ATP-binding protein
MPTGVEEPLQRREPILQGKHLLRTFGADDGEVTALADVSLDLSAGEFALVIGPSGSGKTTLLAVLSGLLTPNTGQVLALGEDLWAMSEKERESFRLRHVGFVFQEYNLLSALTARQQLELVLRWGKRASARAARNRADETLALLGLSRKGHLRPAQLSGGEKQRVAVGRALVKNPTFCFGDEPTGALDWENGKRVIQLLRAAAHNGDAMVLVVAHDERIIPYADRLFYLDDGCLHEAARSQSTPPSQRPLVSTFDPSSAQTSSLDHAIASEEVVPGAGARTMPPILTPQASS